MATYAIYISETYLKQNTNLSSNIDSAIIKPNLRKAQDIYISSYLGKTIDTELQVAIINNSLTPLQTELLDLIKKAQVEFTAYLCYVDVFYRFLNKSANIPATEAGASMTRSDIIYVRDIAKNQGEFYLNKVGEFFKENKDEFPSFFSGCSTKSAFKFQIEYDEKFKNDNYFGNSFN
jgi:hypothetical protein